MMGLFEKLGQQPLQEQRQMTPDDMRREIGTISTNPAAYLGQRGFQIPDGMTDPREITVHLLRTGQIGSGKLREVMRMIGAPGMK